jgi:hypothetical protein
MSINEYHLMLIEKAQLILRFEIELSMCALHLRAYISEGVITKPFLKICESGLVFKSNCPCNFRYACHCIN